jgi:hypothetical protein
MHTSKLHMLFNIITYSEGNNIIINFLFRFFFRGSLFPNFRLEFFFVIFITCSEGNNIIIIYFLFGFFFGGFLEFFVISNFRLFSLLFLGFKRFFYRSWSKIRFRSFAFSYLKIVMKRWKKNIGIWEGIH